MLGIDPRTLAKSSQAGQLTKRVRDALHKGLQSGLGSAAAEQLDRNEKLEHRLDHLETDVRSRLDDLEAEVR